VASEPRSAITRVLFLAAEMEARGTNEYVVHMGAELRRRGLEVKVFCAPGPMLGALERAQVPFETFERLGRVGFRRADRQRLAEAARAFAPQIVHALTARVARLALDVLGDLSVPVVLTVHAPARCRWAFRSLAARLSGIIAATQDVREELVNRLRVEKTRIQVIPNGVDVEGLLARGVRPPFSTEVPVVGSVGPVEHARGYELFVRAAAEVAASEPSLQFVVAGAGRYLPRVRRLARKLGLESRVTFAGDFSSYSEVLDALDVVVQSAQVDVSGFSILDAMAHARPVIAFNTGTACEILEDGKTGILVPREDAAALSQAMRELVGSPERARRMGLEAQRSVASRFNVKLLAEKTLAFYAARACG